MGPRIGRFDPNVRPSMWTGTSPPQFVLGTFLLWFGWYGFNPGSVLKVHNDAYASQVGRVAVVTTVGAGAGAVAAALLSFWRTRTWRLLDICTGLLAGTRSRSWYQVRQPIQLVSGVGLAGAGPGRHLQRVHQYVRRCCAC